MLAPVECLDAIARTGAVPDIDGPAIRVGDGGGRTDESRRAVRIEEVRARDQRNQTPNSWIGRLRALLVAEDEAVQVDALPLSQAFVGREEECPAAPDRTAHRSAELVPVERVRVLGRELEEVPRIERIVPQELERLAAQVVGARLA